MTALVALTTAACSFTGDSAGPAAPSPSGRAAKACRALHDALPKRVDGQRSGTTEPESDYTAVWGDPAVELRCGVAEPAKLTPGNEEYNPTSDAVEVNGVPWLSEQRKGGYRFTTTDKVAYVEVTVPDDYAPEVNPLTDLSDAVKRTVPKKKEG
ncbi:MULTISPECIES: DUF3515 domain-containing protein [unclassified Streptomyces]|uniref:DUF3515 domain-containing protein n=1 Tax=unclassified Streptomyces TaxID=2593676 RepID=UPI002E15A357|nr:DUF3515 domain-containing protein [Streptomyces sp. NBC_01186]WSS44057.1 DUF3515 domain-containing protein [Streptomyces sp. NBC_01187]